MMEFEYKTLSVEATSMWSSKGYKPEKVDPKINELGKEGWELVAASPITVNGTDMNVVYTFKRSIG